MVACRRTPPARPSEPASASPRSSLVEGVTRIEREIPRNPVPRDGIEPPTRGFSRLGGERKSRRLGPFSGVDAAPVPQKARIPLVQPRNPAPEATKERRPGSIFAAVRATPPIQVGLPGKRPATGQLRGAVTAQH